MLIFYYFLYHLQKITVAYLLVLVLTAVSHTLFSSAPSRFQGLFQTA